MRGKGRGRDLAPPWSPPLCDRALRILDPGEAQRGCLPGPRDFPRTCGTMAAGAQHSGLARRRAPWRRSRWPGAARDPRPPRRSRIPTPPALLAGARGAQVAVGRSGGLAVAPDGSHRPRGAGPSTTHNPGTYLCAVSPRGAWSPGLALRPSRALAELRRPWVPESAPHFRIAPPPPRAAPRPALRHHPEPQPRALCTDRSTAHRGEARDLGKTADSSAPLAGLLRESGKTESPCITQSPDTLSPPSPRPPGAGDPLRTGVNGATLQGILRRLRAPVQQTLGRCLLSLTSRPSDGSNSPSDGQAHIIFRSYLRHGLG